MITAVDSSVLWTVFNDETGANEWSQELLEASHAGEQRLDFPVVAFSMLIS